MPATPEYAYQYDDIGNQTLIQTSTGVWSVTYNGENCPTPPLSTPPFPRIFVLPLPLRCRNVVYYSSNGTSLWSRLNLEQIK